jgi:hypothetical protein
MDNGIYEPGEKYQRTIHCIVMGQHSRRELWKIRDSVY